MHYILNREEGIGRPPFINAMLHEHFIEKGVDVPMQYDWNFAPPPEIPKPLPKTLHLISKDKKYNFDFATTFSGHIVSEKFLELMDQFGIPTWERATLSVTNQKGQAISQKKYHFIRELRKFWKSDIVDMEKSKLDIRKNGEIKKIWTLAIKENDFGDIFHSTEIALTGFVFLAINFTKKPEKIEWDGFQLLSCEQISDARFA